MTSEPENIIRADFPHSARATLRRERLLSRLDRGARLIFLQALPGHGKTTLAAQWTARRAARGDVVVSLDLDRHIAEMRDLLIAMRGAASGTRHFPTDKKPHRWQKVVDALAGKDDQSVLLWIDRLDASGDTGALTEELCALAALFTNLRVVGCLRSWHPIISMAQEMGLPLTLITGHELCATPEESARMAECWGYQTTAESVRDVHSQTGGWLMPLRLALENVSLGLPAVSSAVFDHLSAAVIPVIVDLGAVGAARQLAVADSLTRFHVEAIANSVPAGEHGEPVSRGGLLSRLERAGLIEPAADSAFGWRIPEPLRLLLDAEFASSASNGHASCHRIFAQALLGCGDPSLLGAALRHARSGEDWLVLAQVWERWGPVLLNEYAADFSTAYIHIPAHAVIAHPGLRLPAALAPILREPVGGVATERAILQVFRALTNHALKDPSMATGPGHDELGSPGSRKIDARKSGLPLPDDHIDADWLRARSAAVVAARLEGEFERASVGLATLERRVGEHAIRSGQDSRPVLPGWVLEQSALTAALSGDNDRALELASRAFNNAQGPESFSIAAQTAAEMALFLALEGSAPEAHRWLDIKARYDVSGSWRHQLIDLPAHLADALLALDRLDADRAEAALELAGRGAELSELWPYFVEAVTQHALIFGDPMAAFSRMERVEALNAATIRPDSAGRRILDRSRADLLLAMGESNRARRLIADVGPDESWIQVPRARLAVLSGNFAAAARLAAVKVWDGGMTPRDRIDLLFIGAVASFRDGDGLRADEYFGQAVALAEQADTLRPYLQIDREALEYLATRCPATSDGSALRSVAGHRQVFPTHSALIDLSPRELAVLYEMTRHGSVSMIARTLTVSPHTVKKQALAIYAKLQAHSREEALSRAHRLGFLPEPTVPGSPAMAEQDI